MARKSLSAANFVNLGYGQVEPNHLSAQRTAQIYAQLPADAEYNVLENGQFVKYDYANNAVNKTGAGEWMLVFNEIKLYRDHEADCDFAMKKEDYVARVYSPMGDATGTAYARNYDGVVNAYEHDITSTTKPFAIEQRAPQTDMPAGTTMVPRVFKTNVGDIFTTNMINAKVESGSKETGDLVLTAVNAGDTLAPNADGILTIGQEPGADGMKWQVVKVYTMPDRQPAVKIMRIA